MLKLIEKHASAHCKKGCQFCLKNKR